MPEVSCADAGRIIGISDETIRRHVNSGLLPARREGLRKIIWIDLQALRKYAEMYEYRFDEKLAQDLIQA